MAAIEVSRLSYSYRGVDALRGLDFEVPEGALYALLGPNGSGKTTLLQIVAGLRRAARGRVTVLGTDARALTSAHRCRMCYVAEGRALPRWMRLEQLEAYLAPLYPQWDPTLASDLRDRFSLDPARKLGAMSRGERMKAALLCALAPRPELLLMDEPFTGMDALVKDELVRGLLASAGRDGWTVLIASHDIGELELLADWVGIMQRGTMRLSAPMERLRERFSRVTVVGGDALLRARDHDRGWLDVEHAGRRMTFVVEHHGPQNPEGSLRERFAGADQLEIREATLREVFVALAREGSPVGRQEAAA